MDWRRVFFRCTILRHFLARPRGVLSETYRYEEISLFPKDLNENYHPSDFAEKVVDPKSFRNILTSTLGWTVSFVLAFFLVVQLTYTRETIRLLDERQISLAQATADSIATRYRNLGIIAEGALDDFPSQDPSSVAWQRVLQKIQRFAPAVSLHLEKARDNTSHCFLQKLENKVSMSSMFLFLFPLIHHNGMAILPLRCKTLFGFPRPGGLYPMRV